MQKPRPMRGLGLLLGLALGLTGSIPAPESMAAPAGPLVIAHRGGADLWPEETMVAFRGAEDLGADVLEFDVKLTADGVPVVIHDPTLDRTTSCTGLVVDRSFAELSECDAAYWFSPDGGASFPYRGTGVRVPSLEEVLRFATSEGILVTPELKNLPTDADFVLKAGAYTRPIANVVRATGAKALITFASFWPPNLDSIASRLPGIRTALLTQGALEIPPDSPRFPCIANVAFAVLRGYEVSQPEHTSVDIGACLKVARALGREVEPWTVDTAAGMRPLIRAGATGIITNRPDILLAVLGR
jgi:glycerophosphoryl diester phosphodiesterase